MTKEDVVCVCIYLLKFYLANQKKWNYAICSIMHRPREYYALVK